MAEGIMKDLILDEVKSHDNSLPIKVASAGTNAVNGNSATEYALMAAARYKINISFHQSRLLTEEIVDEADLILTMEKSHTNIIKQIWPHVDYVYELKSFGRENNNKGLNDGIMDPIGSDFSVYLKVFNEINDEILRVANTIFSIVREKFPKN